MLSECRTITITIATAVIVTSSYGPAETRRKRR
jgi:hypothetical protein